MASRSKFPSLLIDITQQKYTELLLDASENRFRQIMDNSIEGVLIHRHSKTLFVNQAFVEMLGYASYQSIIALNELTHLIAPHDQKRVTGYARSRLNGEFVPEIYEFDAQHYDGSTLRLELKSCVIDWHEEPALLSTVLDVTERQLKQQEIDQLRRALAQRNRLNMLGELVAGIAHELNQPLTAIANRCGTARYRIENGQVDLAKISAELESIEAQALRSGEIIKQLRSLVSDKSQQYQAIDIAELLATCLELVKFEDVMGHTTISTHIAKRLPTVDADPIQIQQVILNLMRNANDAMQHITPNQRQLTVSAQQNDDGEVQVSVSDNGRGVSEQREAQLFESFFTTKDEGMGMGLPICFKIIELHQGKLWFTRNAKAGVTFHFTLPPFTN